MAHTCSQDLEDRFNTLHSNFTETQQEVRQLSVNISTINKNLHSSIVTSIEELKQDITTQLESIITMIYTKLHILADPPLSDPPLHTEGDTSSHSKNF
jgi:archaellum component FlaC